MDIVAYLVTGLLLANAIASLRHRHSREIYLIWYIFSLGLTVFTALNIIADLSGVETSEVLGPSWAKAMGNVYYELTHIKDEFRLVGGFVLVAVVPQLLAYVLSGPSGSSSSPILVRRIGSIAVLSVVKFLALWSGVVLARPLASLLAGQLVVAHQIGQAYVTLAAAFVLASIERRYLDNTFYITLLPGLQITVRVPALMRGARGLHAWFTRNVVPAAATRSYFSIFGGGSSASGVTSGITSPAPGAPPDRDDEKEWEIAFRHFVVILRGPVAIFLHDRIF